MSKPREFCFVCERTETGSVLKPRTFGFIYTEEPIPPIVKEIQFVEKSALDAANAEIERLKDDNILKRGSINCLRKRHKKLRDRIEKLRAALKWYASMGLDKWVDKGGSIAKEALKADNEAANE